MIIIKCYEGVPNYTQIRELREDIRDIIISSQKIIYYIFNNYWVIDEKDRMRDMSFNLQLEIIICTNDQMAPEDKRINLIFRAYFMKKIVWNKSIYKNNFKKDL